MFRGSLNSLLPPAPISNREIKPFMALLTHKKLTVLCKHQKLCITDSRPKCLTAPPGHQSPQRELGCFSRSGSEEQSFPNMTGPVVATLLLTCVWWTLITSRGPGPFPQLEVNSGWPAFLSSPSASQLRALMKRECTSSPTCTVIGCLHTQRLLPQTNGWTERVLVFMDTHLVRGHRVRVVKATGLQSRNLPGSPKQDQNTAGCIQSRAKCEWAMTVYHGQERTVLSPCGDQLYY